MVQAMLWIVSMLPLMMANAVDNDGNGFEKWIMYLLSVVVRAQDTSPTREGGGGARRSTTTNRVPMAKETSADLKDVNLYA